MGVGWHDGGDAAGQEHQCRRGLVQPLPPGIAVAGAAFSRLGDAVAREDLLLPRGAVFLGIGPAAAVDRYLARTERDVVTGFDSGFGNDNPTYSRRGGAAPSGPPDAQTFWVASQTGAGEQTVEWNPEDGNWRAVVMNVDATRGVSADMSVGAELDSVLWIGLGLLAAGVLLAAAAALAITAGARRRRARA